MQQSESFFTDAPRPYTNIARRREESVAKKEQAVEENGDSNLPLLARSTKENFIPSSLSQSIEWLLSGAGGVQGPNLILHSRSKPGQEAELGLEESGEKQGKDREAKRSSKEKDDDKVKERIAKRGSKENEEIKKEKKEYLAKRSSMEFRRSPSLSPRATFARLGGDRMARVSPRRQRKKPMTGNELDASPASSPPRVSSPPRESSILSSPPQTSLTSLPPNSRGKESGGVGGEMEGSLTEPLSVALPSGELTVEEEQGEKKEGERANIEEKKGERIRSPTESVPRLNLPKKTRLPSPSISRKHYQEEAIHDLSPARKKHIEQT